MITLSTGRTDRAMLQQMADLSGGRAFFRRTSTDLPGKYAA
jgi:hypothetical protein